jgi:hypothetical protein
MTEHDASLTILSAHRLEQLWAEHLKEDKSSAWTARRKIV